MFLYEGLRDSKNGDEDRLWTALRCGQREALDQLFCLFYEPLVNYGVKIIPDEEIVKDGIQELFLRLWKRHTALSKAKSVRAYLMFSLRRILLRQIGNRKKRYERARTYLDEAFSVSFSVEDVIIQIELEEEKKQELIKAINHLNSRQKEALFLRYYHGLSNAEIAEVMQINLQSVRNNLSRALQSLRTIIQPAPLFE